MECVIAGTMRVKKRGDRGYEEVKFDKITERINVLVREGRFESTVNSTIIAQSTIKNLYDGISTEELDYIAASVSESRKLVHPDYSRLAGMIMISNLHKTTPDKFSVCMQGLSERRGKISQRHLQFIIAHADIIDSMINHSADYSFNYIAYRALEKQYLHSVKVPELDALGNQIYVDFDGEVSTDTTVMRKPKYRPRVYDRPQYMFMRVAIEIALCGDTDEALVERTGVHTLELVRRYYRELSEMRFIYATPTNFNACTEFPQLNSCFLLNTEDSIEEIMRTVTNSALISKRAGGIGIAYHKIRCRGAEIKGTAGESSGVVQQLKIFNEDARCWNQGGKRPGSFAIYLEVWHGDILGFLRLKLTQGADTERARDLFYALWICDLFMIRSRTDSPWSLFSEDTAPGLSEVFDGMRVCTTTGLCENRDYMGLVERGVLTCGDVGVVGADPSKLVRTFLSEKSHINEHVRCAKSISTESVSTERKVRSYQYVNVFTNLYTRYEREGRAVRRVLPSVIIDAICEAQRDQGVPYICYKDHANRQTNQRNIGTLQSSNLCTEIYEWHSKDEYACCSLASINLKSYVKAPEAVVGTNTTVSSHPNGEATSINTLLARFDFARMHANTKLVARGLDRIITGNKYPVPECKVGANKLRPIGIGVQGLANVFMELRIPFLSPEAERLDLEIFETLYHAALEASCEMAEEFGAYEGFEGSPLADGILRMDLWLQNQQRMEKYLPASTPVLTIMSQYGFTQSDTSRENTDSPQGSSCEQNTDSPQGIIREQNKVRESACREGTVRGQSTGRTNPSYCGSKVLSGRYDWDAMRARVRKGVRNSLLIAPMPTVTTSILLGNYESFEPAPMNIYTKSIMSGKFTEANEYMIKHLIELGLWNDAMKNRIIANNGSLVNIESIPPNVQAIYTPVWEMKQTAIMRRAALRHVFVDQGQSLNIHLSDNSNAYLRGVLNVGWELGNNTGSYYIRTPPAVEPLKNNIAEVRAQNESTAPQWKVLSDEGSTCAPGCDSCSS
jgi:ribonucleotide reductase alpha subunit